MKKLLAVAIILLFIGMCVVPSGGFTIEKKSTILTTYNGNTLYVGGNGTGNYSSIQEAIDNASDGDTVFVYAYSSPYYENVEVDVSINLIGEDRDTTVIDGNWRGNVINVTAEWITISGFTIRYGNRKGIYFYRSNNNSISGNNIFGNWDGIYLKYSNDNTVIDNIISNNDDGISLWFSGNNNIASNTITSNYNGMYFNGFHVKYNIIISNTISNNYNGIRFVNGKNNTIIGNNISSNHMDGFRFVGGKNNTIYHNNLINNTMNAEDYLHNTWDNGYPSGGNYWDDYNGTDADGDGIGDTPYNISGGDNQDMYPLMEPYGMTKLTMNIRWGLLKFSGIIKNIGNKTAFNVQWKIAIDGGIFVFGRNSSGTLPKPLLVGEEATVSSILVLGFGTIIITIAVWADNAPLISESIPGILLLIFLIMH